jgi:hypothetical protein
MGNLPPLVIILVLGPLLFVGVLSLSLLLISSLGGWRQLADTFPANGPPTGTRFRMQSGSVGWVNYSGCLTVYSSPDGIYLSVMWPFRLGHPPLFIPWTEIHDVTTRRMLWMEDAFFDVGSPSVAKLSLSKKVFQGRELAA